MHLQSRGSKAADRTPLGDYYSKDSRKCKNVELWLNVVVLAYFGILFFSLDVYANVICLFQYLVHSCVLATILNNFAASMWQLSQELLSGNSFTLLNALGGSHSCLCINSLIYMLIYIYICGFIMGISLVKSLKLCFLEAMWEEEAFRVLERT